MYYLPILKILPIETLIANKVNDVNKYIIVFSSRNDQLRYVSFIILWKNCVGFEISERKLWEIIKNYPRIDTLHVN